MIEINRNPSRKELLIFGVLLGPFCAVIGWMLRDAAPGAARMLWFAAAAVSLVGGVLAVCLPEWLRRFYVGWMIVVYPIGWAVSHVIMAVVYYAVVSPLGVVMRLFGYNPMHRHSDHGDTYWIRREPSRDMKRYFRQF